MIYRTRGLDPESLFDHEEVAKRRAARERMVEENRRLDAEDAAARAVRDAAIAQETKRRNAGMVLREYRRVGVEPLEVDEDGCPTCSLAVLFRMGWRVEDVDGERKLVAPPHIPKYVPKGESK